jgi:hypothetical protein
LHIQPASRATGQIPITFRRTTTQSNHAQQVFIASASLEGTKAVDVYFKDRGLGFAMISGLRLQYSGCKLGLLGEDSHDGQTIQLSSSVRTIDVYYSQKYDSQYLIAGLSFTTNDGQASVGICKGDNTDRLHINQVCVLSLKRYVFPDHFSASFKAILRFQPPVHPHSFIRRRCSHSSQYSLVQQWQQAIIALFCVQLFGFAPS